MLQWQGARLLYVVFLLRPDDVQKFAHSSTCMDKRRVINSLLQLLRTPFPEPLPFFVSCVPDGVPPDLSSKLSAMAGMQLVEQAQMRGLLLGVLLQLSLADSFVLKCQLFCCDVPQVLLQFAALSASHPAGACSELVKQLRPDVHAKAIDLHR